MGNFYQQRNPEAMFNIFGRNKVENIDKVLHKTISIRIDKPKAKTYKIKIFRSHVFN